jgi:hypothetical protein
MVGGGCQIVRRGISTSEDIHALKWDKMTWATRRKLGGGPETHVYQMMSFWFDRRNQAAILLRDMFKLHGPLLYLVRGCHDGRATQSDADVLIRVARARARHTFAIYQRIDWHMVQGVSNMVRLPILLSSNLMRSCISTERKRS